VGESGSSLTEVQKHPALLFRIAGSALEEAEALRGRYIADLLHAADAARVALVQSQLVPWVRRLPDGAGPRMVSCFVDGGVGEFELFGSRPVLVRAGLFRVAEGERDLEKRETFAFFPIVLGDLSSGLKRRRDYVTVVRLLAELGAMNRAFEDRRFDDVELLMLHGPLMPVLRPLHEHWFSRTDLVRILGDADAGGAGLVDDLFRHAGPSHLVEGDGLLAVVAIGRLLERACDLARERQVLLCGVVERPSSQEAVRHLAAWVPELEQMQSEDDLVLGLVLRDGEVTEPYSLRARVRGLSGPLQGFDRMLPELCASYLKAGRNGLPLRVEMPAHLSDHQRTTLLLKVRHHASLLPNYVFPLGLDVADKVARVPRWLTGAYRNAILQSVAEQLRSGDLDGRCLTELLSFATVNHRQMARPGVA
jgi:hypothetical protein